MLGRIIVGLRMYFGLRDSIWVQNDVLKGEPYSTDDRAATLDKTLKEWEIGGSGEGVDVVS
jgi:hypothetical protein